MLILLYYTMSMKHETITKINDRKTNRILSYFVFFLLMFNNILNGISNKNRNYMNKIHLNLINTNQIDRFCYVSLSFSDDFAPFLFRLSFGITTQFIKSIQINEPNKMIFFLSIAFFCLFVVVVTVIIIIANHSIQCCYLKHKKKK